MSTGTQFKDLFNREAILDLGKRGAAVVPGLNAQAFVREASQGLESMEMKDRVRHLEEREAERPAQRPLVVDVGKAVVVSVAHGARDRGDCLER